MKVLFIALFSAFLFGQLCSQEADRFATANSAYQQKDYQQAITIYEEIVEQDLSSKELYFNLGNAYYNDGQLGKAILNFEKALKLAPSDNKVKENLEIANAEVELEVLEVPTFFLLRFWRGLSGFFSSTIWVVIQFSLGAIFLIGIYLWRLFRQEAKKMLGFKMALMSLPFFVLSYFAGASASKYEKDSGAGIVITSTALVQEPNEGGEVLEELSPGVKVILLDKVDLWYQVSLLNKEQGWVKAGNIGRI